MEDKKSLAQFFLGSFIISVSSGFGLVKSYNENLVLTALSLGFFILGFRICQDAVSKNNSLLPDINQTVSNLGKWKELILFSSGALLMSQGFIFLTSSISSQTVHYSFMGGILILGGYIPTHLVVNETII